jgi:tetratricopeptide (TPR) repeat protein
MDRERLKQVHTSDLTESKLNQEFVDWLKVKGPTWLLVVMIALCAYLGITKWRTSKAAAQDAAWQALADAKLPNAFKEVAQQYGDFGAIPALARLQAAEEYLKGVQVNQPLGTDPAQANPPALTAEERADYIRQAGELFDLVIAQDDGTLPTTLTAVQALSGRASIAETQGELDKAREWFEKAAKRAEPFYPKMAEVARKRAGSVTDYAAEVALPRRAELSVRSIPAPDEALSLDPAVSEMLPPVESDSAE